MAQHDIRSWSVADSKELYQIDSWGEEYFSISEDGNVMVGPRNGKQQVDLHALTEDLKRRGYHTPLLVRFSDILEHRINTLVGNFHAAIKEYEYEGAYRGVYPIKVNQQRHLVEELVSYGRKHHLGLEAGSKPELLVALTHLDDPEALIVCNGYKDTEYVETALLAKKLGRHTVIVIDRFAELEIIIEASRRLGIRPHVGVRARLTAKGAGKWVESSGDRSKFGLTAAEMVEVVDRLGKEDMLDCLELLHFHIGSQITAIRSIKEALRESTRIFVELWKLGAKLKYMDVGGGLAVDYDGSRTNFHSSSNYSLREYANDVVAEIQYACDEAGIPHPHIVSESGRALVAHHAALLFDVVGVHRIAKGNKPPVPADDAPQVVKDLHETLTTMNRKNYIEGFHDAIDAKEEAITLFNHGYMTLPMRAEAENLFWACSEKVLKLSRDSDPLPEEVEGLERTMCDTYFCNFSVFQSMPDHWTVKQLFPTMPIHRHKEEPNRRGVLADLTCDSFGKVDQFIDLHDVKDVLELHAVKEDEPYYLGVFLVGAYQEILGELHNLFGDTTVMHISIDPNHGHGYRIDRVVEGDSVSEVLGYVQYEKGKMMTRLRNATEEAVRDGRLGMEESALLRRRFEEGLAGYTYLER